MMQQTTRNPAVAKENRLCRLCPEASVRLAVGERKRWLQFHIYSMLTLLWDATINASITDVAHGHLARRVNYK